MAGSDDDGDGELTGKVLAGRYRLIRLVKAGGMGAVYEAEDTKIGSRLAVKILSPEFTQQPDMVRRFFREARAPAFAQHPNIVTYLDFNQIEGGVAYLVMEYLEGDDLERVLKRRGPLPWSELAPLMLQSCRALQAAHAAGIIHRDIKPSNFILLDRGFADGPPIIKLIDFGIAKFTEDSRLHSHTEVTQHLMGSKRFIAPEMYAMIPANPRTDIYALGVTMFRLLTGKYPEPGEDYEMAPPSALRPGSDIPPEVDELILRAIHVNPYARFADMGELEGAILGHLRRPEPPPASEPAAVVAAGTTGPSAVIREATGATLVQRRGVRRWLPVASLMVLTALLAVTTAQLLRGEREPAPPQALLAALVESPAPQTVEKEVEPAPKAEVPETAPGIELTNSGELPGAGGDPPPSVERPPLDPKHVQRRLAGKAKDVSRCGLAGGLFANMRVKVRVRVDSDGKTHPTVLNAGDHDYVQCIVTALRGLQFEPSRDGVTQVKEYKI